MNFLSSGRLACDYKANGKYFIVKKREREIGKLQKGEGEEAARGASLRSENTRERDEISSFLEMKKQSHTGNKGLCVLSLNLRQHRMSEINQQMAGKAEKNGFSRTDTWSRAHMLPMIKIYTGKRRDVSVEHTRVLAQGRGDEEETREATLSGRSLSSRCWHPCTLSASLSQTLASVLPL